VELGVNMTAIGDEWQEGEGQHQVFLLRCWQESDSLNGGGPNESRIWRFALAHVNDPSQTKCFASLEELVAHLRGRLK